MRDAHKTIFEHVEKLLGPGPVQSKLEKQYPFRDRLRHTARVYRWCERLSAAEGLSALDEEILLVSALFHDSGYGVPPVAEHPSRSAEFARDYLTGNEHEGEFVDMVCWLCLNHGFRDGGFADRTLLLSVLQDADRLDETGAMAVLWDAMAEGAEEGQSYERTYERLISMLPRAENRIFELHTDEAKRLYAVKLEFLRAFLNALRVDLGYE